MSTILIAALIALAVIFGLRQTKRKMRTGCCGGASEPVKRIKVKDKEKQNYPYEESFRIADMHCKNCEIRVENAVNAHDGFFAKAKLADKQVTVLAKQPIDRIKVQQWISKAGYSAY